MWLCGYGRLLRAATAAVEWRVLVDCNNNILDAFFVRKFFCVCEIRNANRLYSHSLIVDS